MKNILLEVRNLKKTFGTKTVHQDISFKLHKGECLGLLGGSGTGKSVILRALIGLEKIDSGQIIYEGNEIQNYNEDQWLIAREKISYVFQNGALFDSLTVRENLAYPLREHFKLSEDEISSKITKLLNEIGLENTEELFPSELSGGMQKRVGLLRSIIFSPEIILFDEPTAGLDPFNTLNIQKTILKMKALGFTSVFVSHDMPTALSVCDRILLIKNGRIAEEALPDDIESSNSSLRKFMDGTLKL
jgi:phospholipid/cholesterol/gamma-HCH transport system ATP-binding protein